LSNFIEAMTEWNRKKNDYVKATLEPGKNKAPRKNIFITIPLDFEDDIKDYVRSKRKEADSTHVGTSDLRKTELMLEFEEKSPPPKRSDYE
jgi:hypothetical protein